MNMHGLNEDREEGPVMEGGGAEKPFYGLKGAFESPEYPRLEQIALEASKEVPEVQLEVPPIPKLERVGNVPPKLESTTPKLEKVEPEGPPKLEKVEPVKEEVPKLEKVELPTLPPPAIEKIYDDLHSMYMIVGLNHNTGEHDLGVI
ncbi:MAG: hypothetical protein WC954_06850 [Sphaerochaeta sp.]